MPDLDAAWNKVPGHPQGRWRRFSAALPMRVSLLAVASVWLLGCVWSFQEQSAFAASKGFAFPHLLPLVIDGFAVSMAGVSWAASLDARPAIPARLATVVAVGASSASNGVWAYLRTRHDLVTVVLGVAVPIAANLAFEVLLAELRRQVQRRRGLPPPVAVPYPRLIRLLLAPWQTFRAWRSLVLEITDMEHSVTPSEKPVRARAEVTTSEPRRQPAPAEPAALAAVDPSVEPPNDPSDDIWRSSWISKTRPVPSGQLADTRDDRSANGPAAQATAEAAPREPAWSTGTDPAQLNTGPIRTSPHPTRAAAPPTHTPAESTPATPARPAPASSPPAVPVPAASAPAEVVEPGTPGSRPEPDLEPTPAASRVPAPPEDRPSQQQQHSQQQHSQQRGEGGRPERHDSEHRHNGQRRQQPVPVELAEASDEPTQAEVASSDGQDPSNGRPNRPVDPRVERLAQLLATSEVDELTGESVAKLLDVAPRTGRRLLGQARELVQQRALADQEPDSELSVIGGR